MLRACGDAGLTAGGMDAHSTRPPSAWQYSHGRHSSDAKVCFRRAAKIACIIPSFLSLPRPGPHHRIGCCASRIDSGAVAPDVRAAQISAGPFQVIWAVPAIRGAEGMLAAVFRAWRGLRAVAPLWARSSRVPEERRRNGPGASDPIPGAHGFEELIPSFHVLRGIIGVRAPARGKRRILRTLLADVHVGVRVLVVRGQH